MKKKEDRKMEKHEDEKEDKKLIKKMMKKDDKRMDMKKKEKMIIQFNPMLPVWVKERGTGYAFAMIDYSQEHDIYFVVAMDETGEIWTINNKFVRMQNNYTLGRNVNAIKEGS